MKPTKFLIVFSFIGVFMLSSRATATQHEHPYTQIFQQVAQEFNVPAALLMALGWTESHWSMHDGQPSIDHGYGIMGLRSRWDFDALGRAAHAIGLSPEVLTLDPEANIRGAAALLRNLADGLVREGYPPADDRPETWGDALVRYSGISDPVTGLDYLYQVFYHLNFGVTTRADDGNAMVRIPKLFLDFETLDEHRKSLWQGRDAITPRSEDYPSARWIPADPSNYTVSNRPGTYPIQYVIIHVAQGTYAGTISWFQNSSSNVSAHYVIRSSDGEITQMVRHKDIAWHAGNWNYNTWSIGIEHEGWIDQPSWFTTQMYQASAALTRYIADFYGIPKTRTYIIGHNEVPGATHTDPGPNWDWTYYMQLVSGAAQPDLVVSSLTGPSTGTIGGQITISATVANQGSASAGAFRLGFYYSTDPTITTGDTFSGWSCDFPGGLAAGTTSTCSGSIGVPSSFTPGTYYLGAIVDDLGQVAESNENNNARSADTGSIALNGSTYSLTVSASGSGTGTVTSTTGGINCGTGNTGSCIATLTSGTSVTLTASPTGASSFSGWGGDCAGSGTNPTCTLTMNASKNVTATFNASSTYSLTVSASGSGTGTVTSTTGGINCGTGNTGSCIATLTSGTSVTLTASPTGASSFSGWGGDCAGSGTNPTCTLTMNASKNVTATFNASSTGTLQVMVHRSDTHVALSGALVTVSGPGTLQSNVTLSTGTTTFSNLQAGSYSVTVSLTGFQTGSTTATVSAGITTPVTILLTPDNTQTGHLTVTVRHSDTQAALPGALVTVSTPGTLQSQTTGSNGTTTFSNLQAGSYSLTVSLTGYQTGSTTATVSANTTTSASLSLVPTVTTGTWSGWSALPGGGQTGSQPAAVLDSNGTLRLYIQGIDNGLWVKQKSGGSWTDWSRVSGGGALDGPAAFLDGTAVRLVVRGLDNSLWTALADTPTWQHLGGRTERSPAAVVHVGSPSIFIRGLDGRLYEMLRDQTGVWSQWAEVPGGGQSAGQPAAVVDSTGTLHLYLQGIDNSLWTNQVSPTLAWGQWTVAVGGRSTVGPAAILDGDKVRLIIRGLDNRIWTTLASDAQATQWGSWEDLGGQTLNPPAAVRDGNTLHFFIRGIDGRLYMNSRTGGSGASESEQSEE